MKNKDKLFYKLILLFILFQPIFDVLSFLKIRDIVNLPISTILKPLLVFGTTAFIIFTDKKAFKKWAIYILSLLIYTIGHFIVIYKLGINFSTIIHEMRFILNILYMISLIISLWYIYEKSEEKEKLFKDISTSLIGSIFLYLIIYFISLITGNSALTYEYADASKVGYKGWFDSGQILGHALSIILPFFFVNIVLKKHNFILKVIAIGMIVGCMMLIGTKVPFFMIILVAASLLIATILIKLFNKKNNLKVSTIFLIISLVIIPFLVYEYTPVYTNIKINEDALNKNIVDYTDEEDIDGKSNINYWVSLNTKESMKYSVWAKKASNVLNRKYKNGELHPADSREKQFVYSRNVFKFASIRYKLFGIGFLNQCNGLSLESDIPMLFYCFGILGFALLLFIVLLEYLKSTVFILLNLSKIDLETYSLYIGFSAFFFISIYAGYTFIYTNFSIFLVLIMLLLKIKIRLIAKKNILFISSTGGHMSELMRLSPLFEKYQYTIVSEKTETTKFLKKDFPNNHYFLFYETKLHLFKYIFIFILNIFKSLLIFLKVRPNVVITTGTHTAVPMCFISKFFGNKVIFIETFANSETKTVSGKIIYPIADVFIVQWDSMLKFYPKAIYGGWIY